MTHHNLKLFSKYFNPIFEGNKKSECRFNDRDYQVGDDVTFHEGEPSLDGFSYTGRKVSARISYIDDFGCQFGYVNLSLSDVGLSVADELPEILKDQA